LKEQEKITAYRPNNFFADQLVYARNQQLRRLMDIQEPQRVRMREVGRIGGVQFLYDSACTDIHALNYALESIGHPLYWITCSNDASLPYATLLPLVVEKVKSVICIGEDNSRLVRLFSPYIEVFDCHTMEHAVKTAYYSAESGDVVLLSTPYACNGAAADARNLQVSYRESVSEL